ncbi:TRAP transporter large permease [Gordonia sp. KTR9]|uniref:TRAP transporter large permease n=1 Tax=Gordonia sp. KTR9 TaxID=337191 RepID=UPI00027DD81D|nr:TRAP transporter large permease [Gordonia sp. KTR9]AFR47359.1 TRAP-type C4-dicarboxylate transport system, large permease component [Gordonia sp. KTR9]
MKIKNAQQGPEVAEGTPRQKSVPRPKKNKLWDALFLSLAIPALVLAVIIVSADIDRETVGFLSLILMVLLLAIGVHVAIAMLVAGFLGLWQTGGINVLMVTAEQTPFGAVAGWTLSVIPMFIFMGVALWRFGLTDGLFDAANKWFGRLPGGLAVATNVSGAGLATVSGSTIGISYALGRMALPEMMRAGYKPSIATATVAMAGTLGQIIPPSITLVIFAGVAQVSIGSQLVAGIIPGLILAVAYAALILVWARLDPSAAPPSRAEKASWGDRVASLGVASPLILLMVIVVGGLLVGLFTPTEAGAFASFATLIYGLVSYGRKHGIKAYTSTLVQALRETVSSVATIFLLLIAVTVLTRLLTITGVARLMTDWILGLGLGKIALLLLLMLLFLVLGMFMDGLTMMLVTVPVLTPVLLSYDISMIWFGIFMVVMIEIGMVTPPVGILTYVVHRLSQEPEVNLGREISLVDVFRGVIPFIAVGLGLLVLMMFVPEIATWLPNSATIAE